MWNLYPQITLLLGIQVFVADVISCNKLQKLPANPLVLNSEDKILTLPKSHRLFLRIFRVFNLNLTHKLAISFQLAIYWLPASPCVGDTPGSTDPSLCHRHLPKPSQRNLLPNIAKLGAATEKNMNKLLVWLIAESPG